MGGLQGHITLIITVVCSHIDNMNEEILKETMSFFSLAIDDNLLKFETDKDWLTIYYQETLKAQGGEWKWSMLCAQDLRGYSNTLSLVNRITIMLAEKLRSVKQDSNIVIDEYELIRKSL